MIDWLLIVLPGIIWGASFLFIAEGLTAVAPDGVTFIRILVGFLTLSTMPGARKALQPGDWRGVAALGLLWFAFPMSMFPHAEQWISSALTNAARRQKSHCVGMSRMVSPMLGAVSQQSCFHANSEGNNVSANADARIRTTLASFVFLRLVPDLTRIARGKRCRWCRR